MSTIHTVVITEVIEYGKKDLVYDDADLTVSDVIYAAAYKMTSNTDQCRACS